jgi:hypothetical protein
MSLQDFESKRNKAQKKPVMPLVVVAKARPKNKNVKPVVVDKPVAKAMTKAKKQLVKEGQLSNENLGQDEDLDKETNPNPGVASPHDDDYFDEWECPPWESWENEMFSPIRNNDDEETGAWYEGTDEDEDAEHTTAKDEDVTAEDAEHITAKDEDVTAEDAENKPDEYEEISAEEMLKQEQEFRELLRKAKRAEAEKNLAEAMNAADAAKAELEKL